MKNRSALIYKNLAIWAPALALLLVAASSEFPAPVVGTETLPVFIHLITLGFLVPLFMLFVHRALGNLLVWPKMTLPTALVFVTGFGLFMMGFRYNHIWLLYIGGHYLTPMALYVFCAQAAWTLFKNRQNPTLTPLAWPLGGLFLTLNIGGMLVADLFYGGKYAFFIPHFILTHALSATFLFVLPWILVVQGQTAKLGWGVLGGLLLLSSFFYGHFWENPQAWVLTTILGAGLFFWAGRSFDWADERQKPFKLGWYLGALGLVLSGLSRGVDLNQGAGLMAFGLFVLWGLIMPSLIGQLAPKQTGRLVAGHLGLLLGWGFALALTWALPPWVPALAYLSYWVWALLPLSKEI